MQITGVILSFHSIRNEFRILALKRLSFVCLQLLVRIHEEILYFEMK